MLELHKISIVANFIQLKSFREQYEDVASQAICRLIGYCWLQRLVGENAPFLTWIDPSTESYSRIQFSELTLRTMGSDSFGPSLTFQRYICQSLTSETGTCRTLSLILKAEHTFTSEFLSKWQTWGKIKNRGKESVHWDKGGNWRLTWKVKAHIIQMAGFCNSDLWQITRFYVWQMAGFCSKDVWHERRTLMVGFD